MGKVKGKHRLDKYYTLSKESGYWSRAAFKLTQLDSKYNFFHSSPTVLDLCAAPGSWMQVAADRTPVSRLIVGVDRDPIRPVRGAVAIREDITKPRCKSAIRKVLSDYGRKAFDLVLHDGSPNIGGAMAMEATVQNALVISAVKLAAEFLAPKGTFITKVFRSRDYCAVLYCLKQLFEKVEVVKPHGSRMESCEIYLLGFRYKAPVKIDPRLLDVKHLFNEGKQPAKVVDVLRGSRQKRHRDGYADGETVLRKAFPAADFIGSNNPLDILGSVTTITFEDPESLPIKKNSLTTEEVKALCDDLCVLGKQDFKHLLKWHKQMRQAMFPMKATSGSEESEPPVEDDPEEKVLNEMLELRNAMERKKKKAKILDAKRRAKDRARKGQGMPSDSVMDDFVDQELFSLSSMKGKKDLLAADNNMHEDESSVSGMSDCEGSRDKESDDASRIDTDESRKRYDEQLERFLDEDYEHNVVKKEGKTKQRRRAKKNEGTHLFEGANDNDMIVSDQDSDNDVGDHEVNPLLVPLVEEMQTQEEVAVRWYSQDVFDEDDGMQEFESDDEMKKLDDLTLGEHLKKINEASEKKQPGKNAQNCLQEAQVSKASEDLEIVAAPATDYSSDSSSSDDSDEDEIETKAEILAYAKKMLNKKQRELILDDAYNKYMYHGDDVGLPKWFADEEKKHNQPNKPITKEEIAAMRAHFKEINARPAKKVAEAKARKKRVTLRKLEKVKKAANSISNQTDIHDRSKRRMIEQLYSKAMPKRPRKEYVIAKKGVQVKVELDIYAGLVRGIREWLKRHWKVWLGKANSNRDPIVANLQPEMEDDRIKLDPEAAHYFTMTEFTSIFLDATDIGRTEAWKEMNLAIRCRVPGNSNFVDVDSDSRLFEVLNLHGFDNFINFCVSDSDFNAGDPINLHENIEVESDLHVNTDGLAFGKSQLGFRDNVGSDIDMSLYMSSGDLKLSRGSEVLEKDSFFVNTVVILGQLRENVGMTSGNVIGNQSIVFHDVNDLCKTVNTFLDASVTKEKKKRKRKLHQTKKPCTMRRNSRIFNSKEGTSTDNVDDLVNDERNSEDELYALSDNDDIHLEGDDIMLSKYSTEEFENDGESDSVLSDSEGSNGDNSDSDLEEDPMNGCLNRDEFQVLEGEKFKLLPARWIAEKIEALVRSDRNVKIQVLRETLSKYGIHPLNLQLFRARTLAAENVDGSHADSYKALPKYFQMVMATNPGSVAKIKRHMGLLDAVNKEVPHAVCIENALTIFCPIFKAQFPGLLLTKLFWKASKAYTEVDQKDNGQYSKHKSSGL
ncbi:OLC1v1012335C1 [Oldenlandia corymbosa var. corymbosa]|uniref:OLC1v1012335C1 n=1 Tax=Oldenlandia corymbosa var. corymbosa TaxID=529605 RepID=A0AAV1DWD3_OLDCO|nr:OLC1v1012335C1 [Oldenlandia corymbosa var. corymbosa]